jgi:hydroxymethylbilane synthase
LLDLRPGLEISIVEVSTKGDRDKSDFLYKSGLIGFFTSEIENTILDGRADMAVHSLKDLPTAATDGLAIAALPKREAVADVLVASAKINSIEDLPAGASVGTSSLRRIGQLHHIRDDLNCVAMRGNVETRVSKVAAGQVDAIIIAQAGLNRLGLAENISAVLAPEQFLPAPGQGALAAQVRADDSRLIELVRQVDDNLTRIVVEAERDVLAAMQGGCSIPLGVYARIDDDAIIIDAMICDVEGKRHIKYSRTGHVDQAKIFAKELAQKLLTSGGQEILNEIRISRSNETND